MNFGSEKTITGGRVSRNFFDYFLNKGRGLARNLYGMGFAYHKARFSFALWHGKCFDL